MSTKQLIESFPMALRPVSKKVAGFREGIVAALVALENLNELPSGWKARIGLHYSPPKFNFGWPMLTADLVSTLRARHPDCLVYGTIKNPATGEVYEAFHQEKTLVCVQEELKIPEPWTLCLEDILRREDNDLGCLSLTNSYDNGNETPDADIIEQVKNFFGLEREPRWFLDFHHWQWCQRVFFKRDNGELIATTDF
ncbi:hypothetical protein BDZ89DRAFT_1160982 [Hymenopellis radicata]|nr:hypothetical protein BDZ89DRAFT_1160982 [Hymenopellis radicata]